MPMQRIALSSLCLAAVASISLIVTCVSAEEDPFSDWDVFLTEPDTSTATAEPESSSETQQQAADAPATAKTPADAKTSAAVTSNEKARPARTGTPKSSGMYFFSPGKSASAATDAAQEKQTATQRARMKLLPGDNAGILIQPRPKKKAVGGDGVVHADADSQTTDATKVVPVAGDIGDSFLDYDPGVKATVPAAGKPADREVDDFEAGPAFDETLTFEPVEDNPAVADDIDPFAEDADELVEDAPEQNVAANSPAEFAAEPAPVDDNPFELPEAPAGVSTRVVTSVVPNVDASGLPGEHTGAQSPTVQLNWTRHSDLNVGQECTCSLDVVNTGRSLVRSVTVEAAVPEGLRVVKATPAPQPGTASWSMGDMQPGETKSIDIVIVPERRGDVNLNAFVRFTGYSTSVFTVQEPLLKLTLEGDPEASVGEQATYVVRVENPGTGMARDVVIQARLPAGLEHRSGRFLSIDVGTLNPGESRQARLNLTAVSGGDFRLAVRAVAEGGLKDQTIAAVSIAEPRLEISIAGPDSGSAGTTADYEVVITNSGNVPSSNVRAKYRIPDACRFVKADRGGAYRRDEQTVDWFVGTLQPGASTTYHVTLEAHSPGIANHQAGVVSEHGKVVMGRHAMRVDGRPQIYLDVAASEPAPAAGGEAVIRIIVQNEGSVGADKVGLSCELPAGFEFVSADGPTPHIAENGVVIFRSMPQLNADSQQTYVIKARCRRAGSHEVRVRVASPSLAEPVIGSSSVNVVE